MVKEAKAPMTSVWLKVLQSLYSRAYLRIFFWESTVFFNNHVLCPVKNKHPHYTVISLPLSIVCFHTSFFSTLTLQLPRTALMLCLTELSFTVKIFTERICYFTICHLIAIIAITSDSCLCWLRTAAETGGTFCQVPAVLHREKPEMMLSSVTQGTPTEPPQILSLHLPEGSTGASLSKSA